MNTPLNEEIRDIKPPLDWPGSFFWPWGMLLILLLLLLVGCFVWWQYRKHTLKSSSLTIKSPWEIAYEQLLALERRSLSDSQQFEVFYVELSAITRRYMEERFAIRAPEMTTEEFLNHLGKTSGFNHQQKDALKNFLNACDLVKFARYGPTEKEARESLQLARKLVDETKA